MRVALYTPFVVQQNTGVARYILGLLRALGGVDQTTEYVCFWPPQAPWPAELPPNFLPEPLHIAGANPLARVLREQRWIAGAHRRHPFDVLHSPFGYLPVRPPAPAVLTIHDLRALRWPRSFSRLRGRFLRWAMPRSIRIAARTLASSEATRNDILHWVRGADPARVQTNYLGVDERWFAPVAEEDRQRARARLNGNGPTVLAVSTWEPHKNVPRLVQAVALLRQSGQSGAAVRLALAGATFASGVSDPVRAEIERLGLTNAAVPLGIVPDDELPALYAQADMFCFPSLYEGFGYPPLEAMAAGTPVVTSQASCLPEIVGDAAELVDPLDPAAIAAGLSRALALQGDARTARIAAGRARAARYRWDDHARRVIAAYRDAAAGAGVPSP